MKVMRLDFPQLLKEVDQGIRVGNLQEARRKLARFRQEKVSRKYTVAVASLCRRAELPSISIRVLNPIVRSKPRLMVEATQAERAEYAACLIKIGASDEGLALLRSIQNPELPEIFLYQAFALISQWDYRGSIPNLLTYIKFPGVDEYQRLVAQVNLADAYVHEHDNYRVKELLPSLMEVTRKQRRWLLHGVVLQIGAQHSILNKGWKEARRLLDDSYGILRKTGGLDEFFVRKWKAVLEAHRSGGDRSSLSLLKKIVEEARQRRHWETIRDCDLTKAILTRDRNLLIHLYFGTPFEVFKKRIISESGKEFSLPQSYTWHLKGKGCGVSIDLFSGQVDGKEQGLRPGGVMHRMLSALTSDFYRPLRLATLFSRVYPGEYFNLITSPTRIHQVTQRLKLWFGKNNFPLVIEERTGQYRLLGEVAFRIPNRIVPESYQYALIEKLKSTWPEIPFSAREGGELLGLSRMSVLRLLQLAQRKGWLRRTGRSDLTRYCF